MKHDWMKRVVGQCVMASLACGAIASGLLGSSAVEAASISFWAPTAPTVTTDLDLQYSAGGTLVQAMNIGGSALAVTTPAGQTINFAASNGLGNVNMPAAASASSGFYNGGTQSNAALFTGDTGSANFNTILRSNAWHNNASDATRPLTLRLAGLTIGQAYSVSLFSADARSNDRSQAYWDTFAGGTFSGGTSGSFSQNPATMVIGTFVADATHQDIFLQETDGIGNDDTTIAAYSLYAVPEPASLAMLGLGGLCMVVRRRRHD